MRFLLFLALVVAACLVFYVKVAKEKWAIEGDGASRDDGERDPSAEALSTSASSPTPPATDTPVPLPYNVLTDAQGRKLHCEILGKAADFLAVRRVEDGGEFLLNISQLAEADRQVYAAKPDSNTGAVDRILSGGKSGGLASSRNARWHYSFSNAQREATRVGKPILMVFCANW